MIDLPATVRLFIVIRRQVGERQLIRQAVSISG
jgi:hypothetical protein